MSRAMMSGPEPALLAAMMRMGLVGTAGFGGGAG